MTKRRTEKDSMGEMNVPAEALWGAQTQRAVENFPVSGLRFPRRFIAALGLIKRASARTNRELGRLDVERAEAIACAAGEVAAGDLDDQFVVDVFQTGSGTSTNMNANEVIANRAMQLLGTGPSTPHIHPNDHVNLGQSSNDVIPTAMHLAALQCLEEDLRPALVRLREALRAKAAEFDDVVKVGRTHLQDATPVRLGQEFGGWAGQLDRAVQRVEALRGPLGELALGGTAVGTGINTHPEFAARTIDTLVRDTGLPLREAENHFEAQGARDAMVEASGALRTIATSLWKVADDVRLLSSGPHGGIGEIALPAVQPGSSIMPGKVNPVMAEALTQACALVYGADATVLAAARGSNLELNVMMPVMAHAFLQAAGVLARATDLFATRCVEGIAANRDRCAALVEESLSLVTALAPRIGYDRAAEIVKEAAATGRTIREVCRARKVLPEAELAELLDPLRMTRPGE